MSVRFITLGRWAVLVRREIRDFRKEFHEFMATQADQIAELTQLQTDTAAAINVIGGDIQQLLDMETALQQQVQTLNTQVPQDLAPLINAQQAIRDGLSGLKAKLEAAVPPPPTTAPPTADPGTPPADSGTTPPADTTTTPAV